MKRVIHEHILVCLSSAPSNGNTIRAAAKMSEAFGGTLTALYVQTKGSDQMRLDDRERLQRHIRLAGKLGASVSTVVGDDVAFQIAEFARLSKATKIVIGRSTPPTGRLFPKKTLTERVVELAPQLDVYIIPDSAGENRGRTNPSTKQKILPSVSSFLITLGILLFSTLVGYVFHRLRFTGANTITVYILGVLLTALFTKNYVCSVLSSLAGVLLFNFFFTEPRLSFYAYESGYPITFAIMLFASLMTGTLANRLASEAKQAAQAAWRTQVLLETTQGLGQATEESEILQVVADQLMKLLDRPLIVYPAENGILGHPLKYWPVERVGVDIRGDTEIAEWVYQNKKRAGNSTRHFSNADSLYLAIRSNDESYGVVGIYTNEQPLDPHESGVLLSILGEGALAMESIRHAQQKEEAAVLAKNEQLRANLLRAISHDLRTPLTSISGNVENLLAHKQSMSESEHDEVLQDIYDDSVWLIRLVENLLSITRIGEGHTQLNMTTELVEEVVSESLSHIRPKEHIVESDMGEELLLAQMDARLISQVIINLVDNAIKYTPEGSFIRVSAEKKNKTIIISVADNGPGIPDELKQKVFDMFYTGSAKVADCRRSMGLGLTLCKSIISLHGGEITVKDNSPTGCVFSFTLMTSEAPINE